jgi:5-methyltetrahydrofolate--homocysteine methyltransferase
MKVRALWQFIESEAEGEAIHLFAPGGKEPMHIWKFKRQKTGDQLCLSDYILAPKDGKREHIAVFVVSAGEGIRERAEKAKHDGYYFKSHGLQAHPDCKYFSVGESEG